MFGTIGETVAVGDIELAVTGLSFDNCAGDPVTEALPGNTYAFVMVEISLTRTQGDAGFTGALAWWLTDRTGTERSPSSSTCKGRDDSGFLLPGQTQQRLVAFEIAGNARDLVFNYFAGDDTDEQTIAIRLGE